MSVITGPVSPVWTMALIVLAFTVKHYLADFVLQTNWIAHGKDARTGWLAPLCAHVAIHAGLALILVLAIAPRLWWLAGVDFVIHFGVDRGKTLAGRWGCWTIANAKYWWLFGFDQLLHQATNIGLSALLAVA